MRERLEEKDSPIKRANRILERPVGSRGDMHVKIIQELRWAEKWAYCSAIENVISLLKHRMMERMSNQPVYEELADLCEEVRSLGDV